MKNWIALTFLCGAAFFLSGSAVPGAYFGSSKSNVYHLSSCQYVKKITKEHLVSFQTKEEAQKRGYRPCKICKP